MITVSDSEFFIITPVSLIKLMRMVNSALASSSLASWLLKTRSRKVFPFLSLSVTAYTMVGLLPCLRWWLIFCNMTLRGSWRLYNGNIIVKKKDKSKIMVGCNSKIILINFHLQALQGFIGPFSRNWDISSLSATEYTYSA